MLIGVTLFLVMITAKYMFAEEPVPIPASSCGPAYHTSATGTLQSPNYPRDYPNNAYCEWRINKGSGLEILLTFEDFDIEGYLYCLDYVEVYHEDDTLEGRYCGSAKPSDVISDSSFVTVTFYSDLSVSRRGFLLRWTTIQACPREVLDPSGSRGTFSSPNYPSSAPPWNDCSLTISAGTGQEISITFDWFELEYDYYCSEEYVKVYDNTTLLGTFCGSNIPPTQTSTSSSIEIKFKSGSSERSKKGFHGVYEINACPSEVLDPSGSRGTFSSPNYPSSAPSLEDCSLAISAGTGQEVSITFDWFELELANNCSEEYVKVYDNLTLLGTFCGSDLPPTQTSTSNLIKIKFKSGSSESTKGFHGVYKINAGPCGPTYHTSATGTLQSPNYPGNYPTNVFCEWQIQGEYGSKFHLTFDDFNIEFGVNDHCHDYVDIYHGNNTLQGRYCGNQRPPDVISDYYSFVTVKFSSDHAVTRSGFKLKWTISDSGGGLSAGAIAGIVIACIFGSAVIVFIVWKCNNNKSVAPGR